MVFRCLGIAAIAAWLLLSAQHELSAQQNDLKAQPTDKLEGTKAGDLREVELPGGVKLKLVWCPPGSFKMGSPKEEKGRSFDGREDQVSVTLSHGYWLGQTEITQGQWKALMETEPWKEKSYGQEGSSHAATYVSWEDAAAFSRKLTENERRAGRLPADWEYTLPTEAQWEHGCRAGTASRYHFGDDELGLAEHAWYAKNARDAEQLYAHKVGLKQPNPWKLHDMHGNVWEWCRDWYQAELAGGTDPFVREGSFLRAYRGGSWDLDAGFCRSAYRGGNTPDARNYVTGFRLVLAPAK